MPDCDATFYRFTIHQKNSQQLTAEEEITKKERFKLIEKKTEEYRNKTPQSKNSN